MTHIKLVLNHLLKIAAVAALTIGLVVADIMCVYHNDIYAYAATKYSRVLDDLEADPSFNSSDYGINKGSTTLEVIQIAESSDGELFVYIYNPQADEEYIATYIRLSQTTGDNMVPRDYKLTLLSSSGVYGKYLAVDVKVKADDVRYYDITCVFRKFISGVDEGLDDTIINTISQVACTVAKVYTATTSNGDVTYKCTATEVVEIKDKYVGFRRYPGGFTLIPTYSVKQDSHFVAFSTDRNIEDLYEVDVSFFTQEKTSHGDDADTFGPTQPQTVTITHTQTVLNGTDFFTLSKAYLNKRIEKTSDFMADEQYTDYEITQGTEEGLSGTQYVVRFYESEYVEAGPLVDPSLIINSTIVSDVSILRLKFKEDGKVYNLGVVDNYQTGSQEPINGDKKPDYRWLAILVLSASILAVVVIIIKRKNG